VTDISVSSSKNFDLEKRQKFKDNRVFQKTMSSSTSPPRQDNEDELNAFRENWMTEVAMKISTSQQASSKKDSNSSVELSRSRQASGDQLQRSLSKLALDDKAGESSSTDTSPNRTAKKKDVSNAVEAYVSATRFERFVFVERSR
jgi:hypothetical protein